jgi:DNA-binding MarR family transcriptional regulator
MAEPRWLDEREAQVWQSHMNLMRDLHSELERDLFRDSGLTGAEYQVLVPLSESPEGLLRARELGIAARWDRSRLSHQISRMEKRGLVTREECAEDARGSMVRLTDAGRAAIEAAAPQHVEAVRRLFFDQLSTEEVDTLGSLYERLLAKLDSTASGDPCAG